MFDKNTALYNQAIPIFLNDIGDQVVDSVKYAFGPKVQRIVAFTEFFGASSFAGSHNVDEPKQLVLFDVSVFQKGFIPPKHFLKLFSKADWCAKVVHEGPLTDEFIIDIRESKYPVYEGVVCKGDGWSLKIKTIQFLERLKQERYNIWNEQQDE
jgi:hypothetical protein